MFPQHPLAALRSCFWLQKPSELTGLTRVIRSMCRSCLLESRLGNGLFLQRTMAESPSLAQRVSLLAVNLVNPRFTNFNKPLFLAISVAILSLVCFVPVLGFYLSQETVVVTDESGEGSNLLTGPSYEFFKALMEYAALPERCTLGGESKWFQGNGKNTSEDGLTTVEYSCEYSACIDSSYYLGGGSSPSIKEYSVHGGSIQIDEKAILDNAFWTRCRIPDEFAQGLVRESPFIALYQERNLNISILWRTLDEEAQALSWIKQCCAEIKRTSALSSACQRGANASTFNSTLCHDFFLGTVDYTVALSAQPRPSKYPVCSDNWIQSAPQIAGDISNCTLVDMGGFPMSFKVHWTKKEIKTTRTRPSPLTALSSALALTTYIEIAVTLVVIVILRQLGFVKEIKKFSWEEIMNEQRDPELEQKELEVTRKMTKKGGKTPLSHFSLGSNWCQMSIFIRGEVNIRGN